MVAFPKIKKIAAVVVTTSCLLVPLRLTQNPPTEARALLPFNFDGNVVVNLNSFAFPGGAKPFTVIQIGDSHVQGGFVADELRKLFAQRFGYEAISMGFAFPYSILKTHDPVGYKSSHTGQWGFRKVIGSKEPVNAGLNGACVQTSDPNARFWIRIKGDNQIDSRFNRALIFYQDLKGKALPVASSDYPVTLTEKNHDFLVFEFGEAVDSICISINAADDFDLAIGGLYLWSTHAPLSISPAGLNGATTSAYLNARYLEVQLKILHPDLVILTLGTNDAYSNWFSSSRYTESLQQIIDRIKRSAPNSTILLTTPNDHLLKNLQSNPKVLKVSEIMRQCAKRSSVAVWDFYSLMGGRGSIKNWMQQSLAAPDGIHFTPQGYRLQANLFFTALCNSQFDE